MKDELASLLLGNVVSTEVGPCGSLRDRDKVSGDLSRYEDLGLAQFRRRSIGVRSLACQPRGWRVCAR